ncbi:MAG: hypothetical protein ACK503_12370 [Labrys sp. (in: a-proteobacteria)]
MPLSPADLGTRRIRSAGRSSGSVVITLPPELAGLSGLDCALSLSEGAEPVIEIRPDWKTVHAALDRAWHAMRQEFSGIPVENPALPWQFARIVPRLGRPAVSDGRVDLALEDIGALWQRTPDQPSGDLARLIRFIGSIDARDQGQSDLIADDYGRALSYLFTADSCDVDLFIADLVASVTGVAPLDRVTGTAAIDARDFWARFAPEARRLRLQLFQHEAEGRDRRSDWATAMRFERLSA